MCAALSLGFFLCLRPEQAIRIQQRFYARINWRIEPVSWSMEIRNTRIMGCFLLASVFAAALYLCAKNYTVYFK
jgi:hypothetical protein